MLLALRKENRFLHQSSIKQTILQVNNVVLMASGIDKLYRPIKLGCSNEQTNSRKGLNLFQAVVLVRLVVN